MTAFVESEAGDAALGWLESAGWSLGDGPEIAPGEIAAERRDYPEVVLERRLRDALLPKLICGQLRVGAD